MKKKLEKLHSFLNENFKTKSEESFKSFLSRFSDELITLSQDSEIDSVIDWLNSRKEKLEASVSRIPLKDVSDEWYLSNESGDYEHVTNGFFKIVGVRTETSIRESGKGWDQPMIDQGTESSVAGLKAPAITQVLQKLTAVAMVFSAEICATKPKAIG